MSTRAYPAALATVLIVLLAAPVFAAGLDGIWQVTAQSDQGERHAKLTLQEKAGKVTGRFLREARESDVEGSRDGNTVELIIHYITDSGEMRDVRLHGKLDGDKINGTWSLEEQTGRWEATRGD